MDGHQHMCVVRKPSVRAKEDVFHLSQQNANGHDRHTKATDLRLLLVCLLHRFASLDLGGPNVIAASDAAHAKTDHNCNCLALGFTCHALSLRQFFVHTSPAAQPRDPFAPRPRPRPRPRLRPRLRLLRELHFARHFARHFAWHFAQLCELHLPRGGMMVALRERLQVTTRRLQPNTFDASALGYNSQWWLGTLTVDVSVRCLSRCLRATMAGMQ